MPSSPFSSPPLRTVALLVGGGALGAGVFLPQWAAWLTPLGMVALFLAGLGLHTPSWAVVRPLVPLSLVPVLLSLSKLLERPETLPIPDALKAYAPLLSGLIAVLAGKVLPLHGTVDTTAAAAAEEAPKGVSIGDALERFSQNSGGGSVLLLLACTLGALSGCALGPKRATVTEVLVEVPVVAAPTNLAPTTPEPPTASPFSAGAMLAVGVPLNGGAVLPAQLMVGSLKVTEVGARSINLLAVGGVSGTSVSQAEAAWGAGVALELTPGKFLYEVDVGAGLMWTSSIVGPALFAGVSICPKM